MHPGQEKTPRGVSLDDRTKKGQPFKKPSGLFEFRKGQGGNSSCLFLPRTGNSTRQFENRLERHAKMDVEVPQIIGLVASSLSHIAAAATAAAAAAATTTTTRT